MDRSNDNSNLPPITVPATVTTPRTSPSLPPFSSDLVTRTNLLTREEECTLKTALAFVVIKARAKAKTRARAAGLGENPSNTACNDGSPKKQRTRESFDTAIDGDINCGRGVESNAVSSTAFGSSVLDHLFRTRGASTSSGGHSKGLPTSTPPRFLECTGGRTYINYMFVAAKTLAETWLVANRSQQPWVCRQQKPMAAKNGTNKALAGATGHLAHQLQLLLVSKSTIDRAKKGDVSTIQPSPSTPKHNNKDKFTASNVRYRRPSLSSKSNPDSTSTPSSSSRTAHTTMVVTPATNHNKNDGINEDEDENNQDSTMEGSVFLVQEWIRSTLLHQEENQDEQKGTNRETRVFRTVLSCQNTRVIDVLAAFHVYTVMIPQIARISPPLIGHIFQVVARLVKELYSDQIIAIDKDIASLSKDNHSKTDRGTRAGNLLDHVATSALDLLELCWTTEVSNGRGRIQESHRSFLLLSIQEILGDLLIPLSRSELAGEHYRLTVSASRSRTRYVGGGLLDPEAKLHLRMGVYRLILMGRTGKIHMQRKQG